jgi:hypothetical protein
METVAVYSESKIRTYGFDLREGLNLVEMDLTEDDIHDRADGLSRLHGQGSLFEWLTAWNSQGSCMRFWLLCDDAHARTLAEHMEGVPIKPPVRVDVISFQGPHFGDRHGIADYTLTALKQHEVDIMGMTCSVSGISLVLPRGRGRAAEAALRAAFEIPRKSSSRARPKAKLKNGLMPADEAPPNE